MFDDNESHRTKILGLLSPLLLAHHGNCFDVCWRANEEILLTW
jgi:hypothetical protein